MKMSPMMEQYKEIKSQHEDCILFFRLGDFYEMFFEDAILGAKEMEVTLTSKNCGLEEKAPMCGVPFHAADAYIAKLIEKGYKVAICEQVEDPKESKGIVKRQVIQIITPGTVINQNMLSESESNYLLSIFLGNGRAGLAYCDISTGKCFASDVSTEKSYDELLNQIVKIGPKEIIINEDYTSFMDTGEIAGVTDGYVNKLDSSYFSYDAGENLIKRSFGLSHLMGIGFKEGCPAINATGALLSYLHEMRMDELANITKISYYDTSDFMCLDKSTIKNLELTETLFEKKVHGSLLWVLDKTQTAMGRRLLREWIKEPLTKKFEIDERLDTVAFLAEDVIKANNIDAWLKEIYDLERLTGRIACGGANARDLNALKQSVRVLPELKYDISDSQDPGLAKLNSIIADHGNIFEIIDRAIVDEPAPGIKDGGLIRLGYSKELDELKDSIKDGQCWIAGLEGIERERTGIKNLKVGFNKIFGYYIEVTKSYFHLIPPEYIRKQTLVNCERFVTPELKEAENLVLNAEAKINAMEYDIFSEIREYIKEHTAQIQTTAAAIAKLDLLLSFAKVSVKNNYVRPEIRLDKNISIEGGRHPVIEQTIKDSSFVSNDTYMGGEKGEMLIITGPNMAGKSTYMRQTALIVLMAQIGCFVPAKYASIGIADKIFTRIGASDNLAQGQSTFFVEMSELAYILNTATERSLIILDEIGRGTSTYDGLSIAWAVVTYLCRGKEIIRTLFATHYHELTVLEGSLNGVKNLNVDVSDKDGDVVFLHKITDGSASQSYGIHVAKLAGIPREVLSLASMKLETLEGQELSEYMLKTEEKEKTVEKAVQISMFDEGQWEIIDRIRKINLMELTPSEAIKIIEELKRKAND